MGVVKITASPVNNEGQSTYQPLIPTFMIVNL